MTLYRLGWLGLLVLAVAVTLWLVFGRPAAPVDLADVKPKYASPEAAAPKIQEEPFADLILSMNEMELSLSSSDGSLKVRMWASKAEKNETGYSLEDGVLQFAMEDHNTLMLRVQEATFTTATDTVELSGSLVGHVTGSDQYFEATKLTWNRNETVIHTDKVVYRAPNIDVSGERMTLDFTTGVVSFEGEVQAGI